MIQYNNDCNILSGATLVHSRRDTYFPTYFYTQRFFSFLFYFIILNQQPPPPPRVSSELPISHHKKWTHTFFCAISATSLSSPSPLLALARHRHLPTHLASATISAPSILRPRASVSRLPGPHAPAHHVALLQCGSPPPRHPTPRRPTGPQEASGRQLHGDLPHTPSEPPPSQLPPRQSFPPTSRRPPRRGVRARLCRVGNGHFTTTTVPRSSGHHGASGTFQLH